MKNSWIFRAGIMVLLIGVLSIIEPYVYPSVGRQGEALYDELGNIIDIEYAALDGRADVSGGYLLPIAEDGMVEAFFCATDDCEALLTQFLLSADNSIYCAIYELKHENIIALFNERSDDVEVKIVADNDYPPKGLTAEHMLDTSSQYSHNKFCIVDMEYVWTGSMNPTLRGVGGNDENIVFIKSRIISNNYRDEFDELWSGVFGGGEKTRFPISIAGETLLENYFCPEDGCSSKVIWHIKEATESVHFMTFSFTHQGIADAVINLDESVEVRGIFGNVQAGSRFSQYSRLHGFGLDVIRDRSKFTMHHKVFVIDGEIVITGSFNPTASGDSRNDENIIIIHDEEIAGRYIDEFERVWAIASE